MAELDNRKFQEALKLSEEQFRRAVEDAPIPMIMQAEDGQVLKISRSFTELTGYELSDIPTFDNWVTKTVFGGAEQVRDHMHELFKGNKRSINVNFTVRTTKRGIREWSFSASSPGTLLDGRRFIIGMAVDITDQKRVEDALRKSEEQFREYITKSSAAVYNMNADWSVMRQLQGKDFLADTFHPNRTWVQKYILPNDRQAVLAAINHAIESKTMFELEHRVIRVDGSLGWTLSRAIPLLDKDGNIIEWIGTAIDITARKKAEVALKTRVEQLEITQTKLDKNAADLEMYTTKMEALAKERGTRLEKTQRFAALGQTAGMVGHDIRDPLHVLESNIFTIKEEVKGITQEAARRRILDNLASMDENVGYIDKVMLDLQDMLRPIKPSIEEVKVRDLINTTLAAANLPKSVHSEVVCDEGLITLTDPTLTRRALDNLVKNAVQAMLKGGKLTVTAFNEGGETVISVADTGGVIPDKTGSNLFKPLAIAKEGGHSLGLAVVQRLVEALDGSVTFESKKGKGTVFVIKLPFIRKQGK